MSKLLINEPPLQVLPSLSVKIGLNQSMILQQMHYWLEYKKKMNIDKHKGMYWIYNSYEEWHKQFPFWDIKTIKRAVTSLKDSQLIFIDNFHTDPMKRSNWYAINYDTLEKITNDTDCENDQKSEENSIETKSPNASGHQQGHNVEGGGTICPNAPGQNDPMLYKEAETTYIYPPIVPQEGDTFSLHNKKGKLKEATYSKDFEKFWETYPVKKGKDAAYRAFGKATKRIPVEDLLERVKTFRTLRDEDKSEFIPNPSTWLSQGRWMDEEVEILMKNVDDKKSRAETIQQLKSSGDPWQAFCADLMQKLGVDYKSWIGGKLFLYEIKDEIAYFGCESGFCTDRINQNYIVEIERCFLKHYENVIGVKKVRHIKLSEMPNLPNILIATDV